MSVGVADISNVDRVGFDQVLHGGARVGRARLLSGGYHTRPRRMLWACDNDAVEQPHTGRSPAPDVDLYVVRDAVVGGHGAHLTLDGDMVFASVVYPDYVKYWYEHRITPELWGVTAPVGPEIDTAFVISHFNFVWGHWLTEMYPKLLLMEGLSHLGVRAPILVPSTAPAYVPAIISATLPRHPIITYDPTQESVRVKRALLPHMLNRHYIFHEFLGAALDQRARGAPLHQAPGRLFISRRHLANDASFRRLTNQDEIEGIATELGLEMISPERLSWDDQIARFSNASVVMGEFGSGLHNTLLSPAETKVMALNWVVDVQSRIANFRRQDIGYLLATDGVPRIHNLEGVTHDFVIDPAAFRDKAQLVLDLADKAPLRRYEDIPVLRPEGRREAV
ncbi:MAG: hypothetical protein BGN86_10590 [Caulobacterales bacterium 68-7]|nr:MAG: hypothetical protein BGN86_10590 [Caulobacterales bacterium 68-7]